MTPFEHLAVLISIVLGLALTQLLMTVHRLVQARDRVRIHWLPLAWTGLLFVAQIEWWWQSFGLREETAWNFFYFLFILLSPVSLYLAAAFALPEVERGEGCDLREYYFENHRWFFAVLAVSPALDAVRRGVQAGTLADLGPWSNAMGALLLGSLAFTKKVWYHAAVTLTVAALFLYFIVAAALELG